MKYAIAIDVPCVAILEVENDSNTLIFYIYYA